MSLLETKHLEAGKRLTSAVEEALEALEASGVTAEDADDFIKDCVFEAWWNWQYEPVAAPEEPT